MDEAQYQSIITNLGTLADRLHVIEEKLDTRNTPLWKRIVFRLDGWSSWPTVDEKPKWRPWRRWWTS